MASPRFFAAIAIAAFFLVSPALAEKRVALVVGNSEYEHVASLSNPANDARDMTEKLQSLGFDVMGGADLDRRSLVEQLIRFGRAASEADVALFFYAGHGIQLDGQNYLVPVDALVEYAAEVDISLVSLAGVMQQMERGSETNLIFLDACRNNPFADKLAKSENRSAQSLAKGLGRVKTGSGTFVAFATEPDQVASDGAGRNSPFTGAVLRNISTPGQSISDMMIEVRNAVMKETNQRQVPWDSSSLTGRFSFAPVSSAPADTAKADPNAPSYEAREAYEQAVAVGSCGALQAFGRRYGDSFYAELAKEREAMACAAPVAEQVASVATATRAMKKAGTCEKGPFDVDYCASSVLKPNKAIRYEPSMMFDGNRETAWVEGAGDSGINETLTLHFGRSRRLAGFEIINGYDKTQPIWEANARVKTLEATTSDGRVLTVELQDVRGASRVDFNPAIRSEWLELKIKGVFPGRKYKDTAVSELYPVFAD